MARTRTVPVLPETVKDRIEGAEKRLALFETEAQKLLAGLLAKGRKSRKELAHLMAAVPSEEWQEKAGEIKDQAGVRVDELRERLHELPDRVLGLAGVATAAQVTALSREVERLEKRIEKISKAAAKRPRATATK